MAPSKNLALYQTSLVLIRVMWINKIPTYLPTYLPLKASGTSLSGLDAAKLATKSR